MSDDSAVQIQKFRAQLEMSFWHVLGALRMRTGEPSGQLVDKICDEVAEFVETTARAWTFSGEPKTDRQASIWLAELGLVVMKKFVEKYTPELEERKALLDEEP